MRLKSLGAAAALGTLLAAPAAMAAELTAAHVNPPGEPSNEAFRWLSERINESDLGFTLQVFPQGQVGDEKDAIEQVQLGVISMTTVATANLAAFSDIVGVFDIPFLFRDATEHPWKVVDGPIGAQIAEQVKADSGLEIIAWWSAGMRHVFTRNTPVEEPADLEGLRIRVMGSPVYIDTFNTLGAGTVPTPYAEVYTSLATGVIDAAENDSSGYRNMNFWEQAPYLSLTAHNFLYKPVVANPDHLAQLTPEQRARFDELLAEATEYQRGLFATNFEDDIEFIRGQGVQIVEPNREAFQEKLQPVVDKYSDRYGRDLVEAIIATE